MQLRARQGLLTALAAFLLQTAPLMAGERQLRSLDGSAELSGGFGFANITSNELVYSGGKRLSQLIWTSRYMRVATAKLKINLDSGWVFRASGGFGFGGNGHMADYDWINPYATGTGDNDWSDRSLHPDTRLNQYFEASLEAGREISGNASSSLDLTGGVKFTDVMWTAWGGSYIYSTSAMRDTIGNFAATSKGATFEQRIPVVFAALNGRTQAGKWVFTGRIRGGFTLGANAIDDHWLRNLRFYDNYYIAPVLAGEASAEYHFSENTSAFVTAGFEKVFRAGGDTYTLNTATQVMTQSPGAAGGDFQSLHVSAGIRGRF